MSLALNDFKKMNGPSDWCYKVVGKAGKNDEFVGKFVHYKEYELAERPNPGQDEELKFTRKTFTGKTGSRNTTKILNDLKFVRVGCYTGLKKGRQSRRRQSRRRQSRRRQTRRN